MVLSTGCPLASLLEVILEVLGYGAMQKSTVPGRDKDAHVPQVQNWALTGLKIGASFSFCHFPTVASTQYWLLARLFSSRGQRTDPPCSLYCTYMYYSRASGYSTLEVATPTHYKVRTIRQSVGCVACWFLRVESALLNTSRSTGLCLLVYSTCTTSSSAVKKYESNTIIFVAKNAQDAFLVLHSTAP